MGAFPADNLTVASLDQTTDSPAAARAEILAAVNKIKELIASYGAASGIAPLDGSGKLAASYLSATDVTALLNVATAALKGLMSAADKSKLDGLANYTLPTATPSTLGGVKVGTTLTISGGVLNANDPVAYPVAVNLGGTGATTAATAADNLSVVKRDNGHNAVGSFCFAAPNDATSYAAGSTIAGGSLLTAGVYKRIAGSSANGPIIASSSGLTGTWRALGYVGIHLVDGFWESSATLWQRIA